MLMPSLWQRRLRRSWDPGLYAPAFQHFIAKVGVCDIRIPLQPRGAFVLEGHAAVHNLHIFTQASSDLSQGDHDLAQPLKLRAGSGDICGVRNSASGWQVQGLCGLAGRI